MSSWSRKAAQERGADVDERAACPRYFFHFRDKEEFTDREGIDLQDLETARAEFAIASGEILQGMGKSLRVRLRIGSVADAT